MRIRPIHALITAISIMLLAACGTPAAVDAVNSVTIDQGDQTLTVGETFDYSVTVETTGAADDSVTWSSDNTSVATVDGDGLVTAFESGTADITATSVEDASISDTVTVTVPGQAINDLVIEEGDRTIDVGATVDFTASVTSQGGASEVVNWSSEPPSVATVDSNGTVTGLAPGSAVITAESDFDSSVFDTVTVTVLTAADPNNIFVDDSATAPFNGSAAHPFPTIQEGVDAVNSGGTVNIAPGLGYSAAISIDKSVVLLGAKANSDGSDRGFDESQVSGQITIAGDGIDVAINGIRFRSGAVPSLQSSGAGHTVSITHTLLDGAIRQLFFDDPALLTFDDNAASASLETTGGFLWVSGNWNGTDGTSVSIQNNEFALTDTDAAPMINASSVTGTIANNFINMTGPGDSSQDNSRIGLLLAGRTGDLTVQSNTFANANQGIRFFSISADGLGPVTIENNTIDNVRQGIDVDADGVLNAISVTNNTIRNAVESIVLGQDGVSISSNDFQGASTAYVIEEGGTYDLNAILTSNTFTPAGEVGTVGTFDAIVEQTVP